MPDTRPLMNTRHRLALFLALSTAVHAGILLGGRNHTRELELGTGLDVLSVSLQAIGAAPQRPRPPRAAGEGVTGSASPDRTTAPAAVRALPPANDDGDDTSTANLVRAKVVSELARHFRYPPLARQRGWEGRVLLGFRVEADGLLHQQRVLDTSGFAVLDQAALDSLRRVARVADTGDARLDLKISVLYRLTDAY